MKNYDFKGKRFQVSDPIDNYFECISSCDKKKMDIVLLGVLKY